MSQLRLAVRLPAAFLVTFLFWVLLLVGTPFAWAVGRLSRWRGLMMGGWGRSLAALFGMRIRVEGRPPEEAQLIVSNHLSYMDIVLLGATLRCTFVSKAEVAGWPFIGLAARSAGTLFLDRARKRQLPEVAARMQERLAAGQGLVLFPEGTSTGGDRVLPFRSALLEPAASGGIPVGFASLHYRTPPGWPPAQESVCWWGEMTLAPHVLNLLRMPGFDATVAFGSEPLVASDRKLLAAKLHRAVSELFRPSMEPHSEACLTTPT